MNFQNVNVIVGVIRFGLSTACCCAGMRDSLFGAIRSAKGRWNSLQGKKLDRWVVETLEVDVKLPCETVNNS